MNSGRLFCPGCSCLTPLHDSSCPGVGQCFLRFISAWWLVPCLGDGDSSSWGHSRGVLCCLPRMHANRWFCSKQWRLVCLALVGVYWDASSLAQSVQGSMEGIAARCLMNGKQFPGSWKTCRVGPLKDVKDGFFIRFDGTYDAYWGNFRPAPGHQPSTDGRLMVDDQGNRYRMSGHHSFVLREVGGFHNVIEVNLP